MTNDHPFCAINGIQSKRPHVGLFEGLFQACFDLITDTDHELDERRTVDSFVECADQAYDDRINFNKDEIKTIARKIVFELVAEFRKSGDGWDINEFIADHLDVSPILEYMEYDERYFWFPDHVH